jgi:hypothetical protein
MARHHVVTNAQREARQQLANAAPLVADHAGVREVGVEMKFSDPEGKQQPSPRGSTYTGDMHAYFYFTCPMRDCTGGGFDANDDLQKALSKRRDGHTGKLSCQGVRPRSGFKNAACNIELTYTLAIRAKAKAAA